MSDDAVRVAGSEGPSWQLQRAILVYGDPSSAYATIHEVESKGGKEFRLQAGKPATKEACADLARALGALSTLTGFTPANLLYLGTRSIIWWRPPSPARVFFDTTNKAAADQIDDQDAAKTIGQRNGITPQPGLVFAVDAKSWYVLAVKGIERPEPATPLWRAPYFNVWSPGGRICTGNVRLPETLSAKTIGVFERAFFDSQFTHPNVRAPQKLVTWTGGAYAFWKAGLDGAWPTFPEQALIPEKLTLEGLARRLEKGKHDD